LKGARLWAVAWLGPGARGLVASSGRSGRLPVPGQGKPPLVARFGGIPLKRNTKAVLTDQVPKPVPYPRKELATRLLRGRCELCEEPAQVLVHQVAKLASLTKPGTDQPPWAALMARKRRKTLVVCHPCHQAIHGHPPATAA